MHSYINYEKLRDFRLLKSYKDVELDLLVKYKISNILDDEEALYYIINELYTDYTKHRANYESYIEFGMNARLLMELRKSAIIPFDRSALEFYTGHNSCSTYTDVKEYRRRYLNNLNSDYLDLDWQYYFLIRYSLKKDSIGLIFDFESCFEDGDWRKQTNPEDYKRGFIEAHTKRIEYD